jgi:hypothetical protein
MRHLFLCSIQIAAFAAVIVIFGDMERDGQKQVGFVIAAGFFFALVFTLIFLGAEQGFTDIRAWRRRRLGIDPPLPPKPKKEPRIRLIDIFRWVRAGMPMVSKPTGVDPGVSKFPLDPGSRPRIGGNGRPRIGK